MGRKAAPFSIRTAARADILRQYSYYLLEKSAPSVARRFLDSVELTVKQLCKAPGMGPPKRIANPFLAGLRSWPVTGFPAVRIYYLFAADEVRILRVLHGKRDVAALLEEESSDES
jgi:plasmid stabilization system protein ParE